MPKQTNIYSVSFKSTEWFYIFQLYKDTLVMVMDWKKQHSVWLEQVSKLIESKNSLVHTKQTNILSNFYSQVILREFTTELDAFTSDIQRFLSQAGQLSPTLAGTVRQRAVAVLKQPVNILDHVLLSDIRNMVVFEIYMRCGLTLDTYFERYSSPPGDSLQNQKYASIAHGTAKCTALWTEKLRFQVTAITVLKRFFVVSDMYNGCQPDVSPSNLNWMGTMWVSHVRQYGLADLIWNIFIDLYTLSLWEK